MAHRGTSWEGTRWEARALPRETLVQRLGAAGRRLRGPLAAALFAAVFPALAVLVADPTPASSSGCQAYTTIDNSVRSRTEARCNRPYDAERVYTYTLARNHIGRLAYATKTRAKEKFSVETRSRYSGCTYYQGRGGVAGEEQNYSRTRYYCR